MKNFIQSSLKLASLTALALSFTFSSCKKAETGPQGPAGKDGNANVKSINVFVAASEWANGAGSSKVTKLVPEITADIVNKGAVMVYSQGTAAGSWDALPSTYTNANGVVFSLGYTIEAGKLKMEMQFNSSASLTGGDLGDSNFKVVLIAGSARAANPNVNYNDHKEVETAFNLSN